MQFDKDKFRKARGSLAFTQGLLDQYRAVQINEQGTGLMNPLDEGEQEMRPSPPNESVLDQNRSMDLKPDRSGVMNPLDVGKQELKTKPQEEVLKQYQSMDIAPEGDRIMSPLEVGKQEMVSELPKKEEDEEERFFERLRKFFIGLGREKEE